MKMSEANSEAGLRRALSQGVLRSVFDGGRGFGLDVLKRGVGERSAHPIEGNVADQEFSERC